MYYRQCITIGSGQPGTRASTARFPLPCTQAISHHSKLTDRTYSVLPQFPCTYLEDLVESALTRKD